MRPVDVFRAEEEARRFLRLVDVFRARVKADNDALHNHLICGSKESGAVKRASLDLTRALSDMRKRAQ